MGAVDREYILNWLFKYGGNPIPPPDDFQTNGIIDYVKVEQYKSLETRYKLFNHFQVKFRVLPNNGWYDVFNGEPIRLARDFRDTEVGRTKDPVTGLEFKGQYGPQDLWKVSIYSAAHGLPYEVSLINDGSPDYRGINVTNELMGDPRHLIEGAPRFWENIGSRIMYRALNVTQSTVFAQPYPTYWVYINGELSFVIPQAPKPADHFYSHSWDPATGTLKGSYPFGTQPSSGSGGTIPGGRNGDATTAPDATSRIPPSGVYYNGNGGFV
jgi:hypothetical protein